MANQYGNNLHLSIYGGSHDAEIGMRLSGFPKGFALDPWTDRALRGQGLGGCVCSCVL